MTRDRRDNEIIRDLLVRIDETDRINQRRLSQELGIALGLTNAYVKRCVKKGLIKISQVPARRYRYYLTPKGFAEKSRLTAQYFSSSLFLFREARNQFTELLHLCQTRRWHRVALYGNSELSEIASLCAIGLPLVISGIVDHDGRSGHVAGHRLVPVLETLGEIDAVIITDLNDPQGAFDALMVTVPSERILAPRLLNISREPKAT